MNCLSLQRNFWGFFFVTLLLSLIITKCEANVQVQEDNSTSTQLQCPYVRALSAQKKEKLEGRQTNNFAEMIVIMLLAYKLAYFSTYNTHLVEDYK